jgi:hypothetical protein
MQTREATCRWDSIWVGDHGLLESIIVAAVDSCLLFVSFENENENLIETEKGS